MKDVTIVLGNKNYSSWSLRGWLAVAQSGLTYDEVMIPLRGTETKAEILRYSPSGKVPALIAGDQVIWDSLAIGEYLAERCPDAGLWPADPAARAHARAVTAEMHSGFRICAFTCPCTSLAATRALAVATASATTSRGFRRSGATAATASGRAVTSCSAPSAWPMPPMHRWSRVSQPTRSSWSRPPRLPGCGAVVAGHGRLDRGCRCRALDY